MSTENGRPERTSESKAPVSGTRRDGRRRWAPWWLYVIVLAPANWIRAGLVPADKLPTAVVVVIAVAQAAILFMTITVIWRAARSAGE